MQPHCPSHNHDFNAHMFTFALYFACWKWRKGRGAKAKRKRGEGNKEEKGEREEEEPPVARAKQIGAMTHKRYEMLYNTHNNHKMENNVKLSKRIDMQIIQIN